MQFSLDLLCSAVPAVWEENRVTSITSWDTEEEEERRVPELTSDPFRDLWHPEETLNPSTPAAAPHDQIPAAGAHS